MNEDQVEREVERRMNRLDAAFIRGETTLKFYDQQVRELDAWAKKAMSK